ncbi:hypothetical protein U753_07970 [Streptococcus pseudopneumoniae 5247]|nr:hypothetical protein U753_07970 [Streptococcus pseudopneumoniae 5247]
MANLNLKFGLGEFLQTTSAWSVLPATSKLVLWSSWV